MTLETVAAPVSGTVPIESYGVCGGRPDWMDDNGWLGCLDAPDLILVGCTRAVFIDPSIGGCGYEGNVAVSMKRF
jgi:hypothetical protein